MSRYLHAARMGLSTGLLAMLTACSALNSSPTALHASVSASARINLDSRGRSTPVVIRVYLLKSLAAFNAADFFSLYEKEQQTLADNLVSRDEITLRPGETKVLQTLSGSQGAYVGVIAAFRNIDRAAWRSSAALANGKTNEIRIAVENDRVIISANPR